MFMPLQSYAIIPRPTNTAPIQLGLARHTPGEGEELVLLGDDCVLISFNPLHPVFQPYSLSILPPPVSLWPDYQSYH